MTSPFVHLDAAPVAEAGRIDALDVLRGVAVLGILVMNIQAFAMPEAAYFNPTAYGNLEGANLNVWVAGRLLADRDAPSQPRTFTQEPTLANLAQL